MRSSIELRERLRVVAVDELHADAEAREGDLELVVGAAVEVAGRDDVVAGLQDRRERQELRRLAARGGERRRTALERRDALLEDVGRRVHDPRVDVAELLQREEPRAVLGVVEGVGRGLVDRHRARVGPGRGLLPGVDLQRLESVARLLVAHRPLLCGPPRRAVLGFGGRWATKNPPRLSRCGSLRLRQAVVPASLRALPPARARCTWTYTCTSPGAGGKWRRWAESTLPTS